jgi:hypothetical protein
MSGFMDNQLCLRKVCHPHVHGSALVDHLVGARHSSLVLIGGWRSIDNTLIEKDITEIHLVRFVHMSHVAIFAFG